MAGQQPRSIPPEILKCYGWYEYPINRINIVMEYLPEGDLRNYLQKQPVTPETEAREMVESILKGLEFLHQHSIAHRDLKPAVSKLKRNALVFRK